MELTKSAAQILSGSKSTSSNPHDLLSSVEAANQVATCVYEYGTTWGREVGATFLASIFIHGINLFMEAP